MAWRFKASKYKNAAPIVPKPEVCIRDICVGSYQTYGNNIAASGAFMAFNWEHAGSSLAVLPLDDCGRKSKTMPLLHGHTDTVTDLGFSPFHDGLLATGSQDCLVKLWHIPEKGLETSLTNPECTFSHKQRRVETVGFHPTADCLLHSTSAGNISLWDITAQKEALATNEHPDVIQSLSWKQDGTVLATSCKDKMVRVIDPRSPVPIQLTAASHQSIKDSRVVWMGNQQRIITTGFDAARLRQIIIRDLRNFSVPEKTLELDCSTGILMPLYDPDTNMLFLAGKGDTTIAYMEVTDKDPHFIEGLRHNGEQTKGACLVPKRALRVMEGEVNRIMQLTSNSVIPIMYQVPRKTYRDFHADLYPDTNGYRTDLGVAQWLAGANLAVPKMSLDPAKRELGEQPIVIHRGNLTETIKNNVNRPPATITASINKKPNNHSVTFPPTLCVIPKQPAVDGDTKLDGCFKKDQDDDDHELAQQLKKMDILQKFDNKYQEEEKPQQLDNRISAGNSFEEDVYIQNGNGGLLNSSITPPKPLPRTSRNNSVSDQGGTTTSPPSGSDDSLSERSSTTTRPVARPRTSTTYKPRLGPKPFSSVSADISFDQTFSVPSAPGSLDDGDTVAETQQQESQPPGVDVVESLQEDDSGGLCDDQVLLREKVTGDSNEDFTNGELSDQTESNSLEEDLQKAISTAERRKIFESNRSESENSLNGEDKTETELRRMSLNRCSIADRRKMYEGRSMSVQVGEKPMSPLPIKKESLQKRSQSPSKSLERKPSPSDIFKVPQDSNRGDVVDNNGVKKNSAATTKKATTVEPTTATKRTSTVFGKVSKFRHLKGTPGHKSTHIENIRNISRQIPGECNGFHANHKRVAVPISGPGGKIAVYELGRPGRLPDGVIPSLVNGSNIMDFQWDPFDVDVLAVACDDGIVKLWRVPDDGLKEPTNEAHTELAAHSDKIYFIRFHPLAKNVLLTASYDMSIKLWDLSTRTEKMCLNGHTDQIFDFAWSPCGVFGATVCKDGRIRVYNTRKSENPIREGPGPVGTRGARIAWAIEGHYIICTGFDKVSERQISIYKATDLSAPLNTVGLDVSPAILQPFYDEDSSTLFVTGKGDSTIYAFEITDEPPHICPLSHHRSNSLHQGLSFLSKNYCDVSAVEFAKALRLTNNTVEPLSFTVPRIKSELFQDDLFPPTTVTWTPTMTSEEWYSHKDRKVVKISLQPQGMDSLSSIQPTIAPTPTRPQNTDNNVIGRHHHNSLSESSSKSKQDEIQRALASRLEINTKLEQDDMEGVDAAEWIE